MGALLGGLLSGYGEQIEKTNEKKQRQEAEDRQTKVKLLTSMLDRPDFDTSKLPVLTDMLLETLHGQQKGKGKGQGQGQGQGKGKGQGEHPLKGLVTRLLKGEQKQPEGGLSGLSGQSVQGMLLSPERQAEISSQQAEAKRTADTRAAVEKERGVQGVRTESEEASRKRQIEEMRAAGYTDEQIGEAVYKIPKPPAPATQKATTVKTADGKVHSVWEDPKSGTFRYIGGEKAGQMVDPKEIQEVGAKQEERLTGELKQLSDANKILADPQSQPNDKQAAQMVIDRHRASLQATQTRVIINQGTDEDIKGVADGIEAGLIPPIMTGFGRGNNAMKIRSELSKRGFNLAQAESDWRATQRWLSSMNSQQQLRLRQATDFAMESLSLVDSFNSELRRLVPRSQVNVITKASMAAAKNGAYGKEAAVAATNLDNQIRDLQAEIATVYKGGNSPTDIGLKQAQDILNSDWSTEKLSAAVQLARKNLGLRLNSIRSTEAVGGGKYAQGAGESARKDIGQEEEQGTSTQVTSPIRVISDFPADKAKQIKEGEVKYIKGPGGKTYKVQKRGGKVWEVQ